LEDGVKEGWDVGYEAWEMGWQGWGDEEDGQYGQVGWGRVVEKLEA